MKINFLFFLLIVIILSACSSEKEKVTLEQGTPTYTLAKELTSVVPGIDPDSNKVLISADKFEITTGEVMQALVKNFGPRVADLKKMNVANVKQIIEGNATKIGEQRLLINAAHNMGIEASNEVVDSLLQVQFKTVGGEEKFMQFIEKNGVSMDVVRDDIRNQYTIEQYLDKVVSEQVVVDDAELQKIYDNLTQGDKKATVRHILLVTRGKSEAEKKVIYEKMKKILARAKAGEDFAQLAKTYSEDPGSKEKGGLYEDFEKGAMVKPFEDAAFSVPIGKISDIVETMYGYHILKVLDRKSETRSFDEMKDELQNKIKNDKQREIVTNQITKLKEEHNYKKFDL
jgi:parvulin-like peptidyl-prolyl isomerase